MFIEVDDRAGQQFTVQRVPAREITNDDTVVYWNGTRLVSRSVTASNRHPSGRWYLALEQYGHELLPSGQYIGRLVE
ncbi:hypothetical protein [Pseudomonas oryzicola]|uniref:Uncharacterized protein n=1 Tax=Pseudomonas oryzicola TaxID=485876 RepID=A0ABS6QBP3_9PSED|nr:hypothetical protein [Pseudomonas oryzicola]MBV4491603.1 hypothetical protein [Pseudomonas oryzicola]